MPFVKGKSGNPGGRPKGSKSLIYSIRDMVAEAVTDPDTKQQAIAKLRENLTQRKSNLAALEFSARVNKEIGLGSGEGGGGGVTIILLSNVDPSKLAAAKSRALAQQA